MHIGPGALTHKGFGKTQIENHSTDSGYEYIIRRPLSCTADRRSLQRQGVLSLGTLPDVSQDSGLLAVGPYQ